MIISINLPKKQVKKIKKQAEKEKRSVSNLISMVIGKYLKGE